MTSVDFNALTSVYTVTRSITRDGTSNPLDPGLLLDGVSGSRTVSVAYTHAGGGSYVLARFNYRDTAAGVTLACTPTAPAAIAWNGAALDVRRSIPSTVTCVEGTRTYTFVPGAMVVLREDFQVPIDGANPTSYTADNYAHTLLASGPSWLHLQNYVGVHIEIDHDRAICH